MNELKEKALAKMLDEMNNKHSQAEDAIHNWLSEQEDTKLLEGVIDANKSIKGAMDYCIDQARKLKTGNCAMVDDQTVFKWVYKYFTGKLLKKSSRSTSSTSSEVVKVKTGTVSPTKIEDPQSTKKIKKSEGVVDGQLDLFGSLL